MLVIRMVQLQVEAKVRVERGIPWHNREWTTGPKEPSRA